MDILGNVALVLGGLVFLYLWLVSIRSILSARQEGPRRKAYLDDKLIGELKEMISKGGGEGSEGAGEPFTNVLRDIYDDLYNMISEEESERKKEVQGLRAEIDKLRGEIEKNREK